MDWTMEADQHVLVVSLVGGRRAVPMYWRAYQASVVNGRMKRSELAVIRRAVGRVAQAMGTRRVIVTADRGCADVDLFTVLNQWGLTCIIRVKADTHVSFRGQWRPWGQWRFLGNARHRRFGAVAYGGRGPPRRWWAKRRDRGAQSNWGIGHLGRRRADAAPAA